MSDLFTPAGRTTILVMWEMSVKQVNAGQCEFINHVRSRATDDLWSLLARQGIPFEVLRAQRPPMSGAGLAGSDDDDLLPQGALSNQPSTANQLHRGVRSWHQARLDGG